MSWDTNAVPLLGTTAVLKRITCTWPLNCKTQQNNRFPSQDAYESMEGSTADDLYWIGMSIKYTGGQW